MANTTKHSLFDDICREYGVLTLGGINIAVKGYLIRRIFLFISRGVKILVKLVIVTIEGRHIELQSLTEIVLQCCTPKVSVQLSRINSRISENDILQGFDGTSICTGRNTSIDKPLVIESS